MKKVKKRIRFWIPLVVMAVLTGHVWADATLTELWQASVQAEIEGDYALALEQHEALRPMAGKSYMVSLRAGWLFYKTSRYDKALDHYEEAAGLSPGALTPLCGMMNCLAALEKSDKAATVAKSILSIDKQNYTATLQLASSYYTQQKFSQAASYYRKLNRLYPEDLAAASGLAWSYLEQGERNKAEPLFEEILMISPDYAYAQQGLSLCDTTDRQQGGRR